MPRYFCHTKCYWKDQLFDEGQIYVSKGSEKVPEHFKLEPYVAPTLEEQPLTSDAREVNLGEARTLKDLTEIASKSHDADMTAAAPAPKAKR